VFEGSYEALKHADTLTGQFLKQHLPIKRTRLMSNSRAGYAIVGA
jgi:hypothetical protein